VGSKIRVHHLLRSYGEMGEVTLVCLALDEVEAGNAPELERIAHRVHCLPLAQRSAGGRRLETLRQAVGPVPSSVRSLRSLALSRLVESLVLAEDFDVLHVERIHMAENVERLLRSSRPRPLRVLDLDDLESGKALRMVALSRWHLRRKVLLGLDYLKMVAFERRVLPGFDHALVCSERDRSLVEKGQRRPTFHVFPNGADVDATSEPREPRDDGRTLGFLGGLSYAPNSDAVLFFATSVLPLLRRRVPDVRLIIAGKTPPPQIRALDNGRDVLVTGYVEDKAALFDSCTVFVAPIRIGGGTRIKILEAMSAGKPVVSTSVGCEGIDVTPGENILVADEPQALADACANLLLGQDRRRALAQAGRRLVLERYRWEAIRRDYVRLLGELWRAPASPAPPR
jgi:glycosyltransferase involved in cell wall biosynthesis